MWEEWEPALADLRSMLEADGYQLQMEAPASPGSGLLLTVAATADACEECLVPIALFKEIVAQHLMSSGFRDGFTVVYPNGETLALAASIDG